MTRLWVRLIRHHRILSQDTQPCAWGEEQDALREICRQMDVPAPLWFSKNDSEWERFRRTSFIADNFMEKISFDRLEIEFLDDDDSSHSSRDPRNSMDGE